MAVAPMGVAVSSVGEAGAVAVAPMGVAVSSASGVGAVPVTPTGVALSSTGGVCALGVWLARAGVDKRATGGVGPPLSVQASAASTRANTGRRIRRVGIVVSRTAATAGLGESPAEISLAYTAVPHCCRGRRGHGRPMRAEAGRCPSTAVSRVAPSARGALAISIPRSGKLIRDATAW